MTRYKNDNVLCLTSRKGIIHFGHYRLDWNGVVGRKMCFRNANIDTNGMEDENSSRESRKRAKW